MCSRLSACMPLMCSKLLIYSRVPIPFQMLSDKGNTAVYLLYAYTRIRSGTFVLLVSSIRRLYVTLFLTKYMYVSEECVVALQVDLTYQVGF